MTPPPESAAPVWVRAADALAVTFLCLGLFTLVFAWAIRPDHGVQVPGTPFGLAAALLVAAMVIAWRVTRPTRAASSSGTS